MFYFLFKRIIRVSLKLYFKKIRIEGLENVPKNIPLLVTPNHQNALLDALIVGVFIPLDLHFLARQDVFTLYTRRIFKALKMMPIYRIRDGYATLRKNEAIFETCAQLFSQNKSILIFPEGNHGEHHYLRPLTKGAPRIALKAQAKIAENLMVLPVGINYFDHLASRSTVVLVFGKPIKVKDYQHSYQLDEAKGLIEFRNSIAEAMKETLVIPENSDDYETKRRAIFKRCNEDLSFEALRQVKVENPINKEKKRKRNLARVLNPVPFLIIKRTLDRIDDQVFHSSIKFAVGLFVFPVWWFVVLIISSLFLGIQIGALLVFTMVMGLIYSYQEWS